jgi:hypothetical protein
MDRRLLAAALALVATGWAVWLVAGHTHYPHEGPFLSLTATHGVHVGDVVILSVWALLMWRLHRMAFRRRSTGRAADRGQL